MDKVTGVLEVGTNDKGEVVINHPDLLPDENGVGHIVFSPDQARKLALLMLRNASEADGFPGSGEEGEFFINFDTRIFPGKLQAIRVRIDVCKVSDMNRPMDLGLSDHPLYRELCDYVDGNPRKKGRQ